MHVLIIVISIDANISMCVHCLCMYAAGLVNNTVCCGVALVHMVHIICQNIYSFIDVRTQHSQLLCNPGRLLLPPIITVHVSDISRNCISKPRLQINVLPKCLQNIKLAPSAHLNICGGICSMISLYISL